MDFHQSSKICAGLSARGVACLVVESWILFGEKNCPLGRFLSPALCTASHRVLRPWGLILVESRLPGGVFLRMKPSDTLGGNLGFSPNGGLRGRNSMRSGAKGGAQGWTAVFAPTIAVNGCAGYSTCAELPKHKSEPICSSFQYVLDGYTGSRVAKILRYISSVSVAVRTRFGLPFVGS